MSPIDATQPVAPERAADYRAKGLWDDRTLADGIERAAAATPDAVALVDNERVLTWSELASAVHAGVAALAREGLAAGDGAILVAGNTAPAVVAYHALLRSGATVVVLDRRCGPADVRHACEILGDRLRAVVPEGLRAMLLSELPDLPITTLEALATAAPPNEPEQLPEPDRDRPAVVLFTSGTTSRPKAVVHSLNTLTAGARNMAAIMPPTAETAFFLVSPLTSIAGIMQVHYSADQHTRLVLEDAFDAATSLDRLLEHGATTFGGAPVILERLLRAAEARPDRRIGLRTIGLGGAMLPLPLLELATDGFGIEVARVYGSSEAPNATGSLPDDDRERRLADDGALTAGLEVRVGSKEHGQEGLLRGPCVFLGYADASDTEAAFEEGWFRTGDAVDVDEGRLTVVGRLKEVVNRNGLKISLAEVDGALAGLPDAIELACFGVPDADTGERLAVAVRPEPGAAMTIEHVLAQLESEGLAVRKLPEQLVVWDEPLPRTASGKIVRARLVRESSGKPSQWGARLRTAGDDPTS